MIRRPGITDVAARAGVSIKTVSRVVNDEAAVRPETRERVLAAVEELGYVPSTAARSLKSGTGRAVGVVIDSLADPFFAAIAAAIEQRAVAEGLTILVASSERDEERERDLLLSFLGGHKVMGVIFAPMASDYPYLDAFRGSAPLVAIDRAVTGIDSVVIDDEGAARQAAEYLVGLGHRRIAFIDNDPRFLTVRRRVIGYRAVLGESGIADDPRLMVDRIDGVLDYEAQIDRMLALPDPPTAFFASNSWAAMALSAVLHRTGRQRIPVISFGDFPFADVVEPGVSCIDQDPTVIGNAAFDRLLALRDAGGRRAPHPEAGARSADAPREWIVPTHLIRRGAESHSSLPVRTPGTLAS